MSIYVVYCTGPRVLTGIYPRGILWPNCVLHNHSHIDRLLAIWFLTEVSCFVCRERNKDTACVFIFFSSFKAYPWLLCKTQELEEVRGTIIGVEYTKLYFLWWVHSDAASIFYCSSIHWAACMGVLPAVIASINSDPPAKEQTHPLLMNKVSVFLGSYWMFLNFFLEFGDQRKFAKIYIDHDLHLPRPCRCTLHKRKCHETFETEKTCMEVQTMGWT